MASPCGSLNVDSRDIMVSDYAPTPIFQINDKGELITGTIKQVKQCNSCGAVGKINCECEYCGNIVY